MKSGVTLYLRLTVRAVALLYVFSGSGLPFSVQAQTSPLAQYDLVPAPEPAGLLLREGDRLAICGDSITEQKMYSRIIEDYLIMCVPQLEVTVRQYGWSGERAPGFLARMTNDCLRFFPTIATTCYGMNDHQYRPYEESIGSAYRTYSTSIIKAFKAHGVEVVQGSPGCVGKMPHWVKSASGSVDDLNRSLATLRNVGIDVAKAERAAFADVFAPMIMAGAKGQTLYGTNYAVAGQDGVHPGWAGQTVMAYAFLKALGLNGEIASLTADLGKGTMDTSPGHEVRQQQPSRYEVTSSRYPFCPCSPEELPNSNYPVCAKDDISKDSSIQSALTLIPFNSELNRFMLVGKNGKADFYKVTWSSLGKEGPSKVFSSAQLLRGVNLSEEFPVNPFSESFARVDAAVLAKQTHETRQVKQVFHGDEGKANMEAAVARTEAERAPLVRGIQRAFQPVTHVILIEPVKGR